MAAAVEVQSIPITGHFQDKQSDGTVSGVSLSALNPETTNQEVGFKWQFDQCHWVLEKGSIASCLDTSIY